MGLLINLLTLLLLINSILLILLILIQLPKKEAGAGLAFGGGASDALFGAGSGTVLTRITKYAAGLFLVLSMFVSILYTHQAKASRASVLKAIDREATAAPAPPPSPALPTNLTVPANAPTALSNVPAPASASTAAPAPATLATNVLSTPAPSTNPIAPPVAPGR